jgi:hypothetical protein
MLRARDALVAARTEIINTTPGLIKSMGTRLPKCSSRSFAQKGQETVPVEVREALLPLVRSARCMLILLPAQLFNLFVVLLNISTQCCC